MSTIHSRKSKGRRARYYVRDLLLEKTKQFGLVEGDIVSIPGGQSGRDLSFSPLGDSIINFDVEVKNQENINILSCILQSEYNTKPGRIPLLVFTRNRSKYYACLNIENICSKLLETKNLFNLLIF